MNISAGSQWNTRRLGSHAMPGGFDARRRRLCPGGFEVVEALKSFLPRIGPYPLGVALD